MRMRLLYIHHHKPDSIGANFIQVASMCSAFLFHNVDVILCIPGDPNINKNILKDHFSLNFLNNIEIIQLPEKVSHFSFLKNENSYALFQLIKEINPDLTFIRSVRFLSTIKKTKLNFIFETHNATGKSWNPINKYLCRKIKNHVNTDKCKLFISISDELRKYWLKIGIKSEKILVAHDGYNEISYKISDRNELREILGIPLSTKVVVYAGKLSQDRNIELIIRLAKLNKEKIFLILGGTIKQVRLYVSISNTLGVSNIHFLGLIPHKNVNQYLFAADAALAFWSNKVRTINYCSPLKLFEYMSAGIPMVVHSFPTIAEIIPNVELTYFALPDNLNSAHEALNRLFQDEKRYEKSFLLKKIVEEKYSWIKRAENIILSLKISYEKN